MTRNRKRSRKIQRQDARLSFTEDVNTDAKDVPDPTGTTPPPDQGPDK
jgi:hypothetical protein